MSHEPVARLDALPPSFEATVAALHRVAEQVVSPARKPPNEIALQPTPGGFGTPVFEHGGLRQQVRVEGAELVHVSGAEERRAPLTSLGVARRLVADLLPADAAAHDEPLDVDPVAAARLAGWLAFGAAILMQLAMTATNDDAPTPVRLWPEHFDLAIELGAEQSGRRANYGFSPGDAQHPEPYAYLGPWTAEVAGDLWQATGFAGAELSHAALLAAPDQTTAALDFFAIRKQALDET